jgi:outer membrane receptor protein involved in Fe transport
VILLAISIYAELRLNTFTPWASEYRFSGIVHPNTQGGACGLMVIASFFGMKASRRGKFLYFLFFLLGSKYNYTATAFLVDWKNFQATLTSPFGIIFVDNVPSAESQGLEFEVSGQVTDRFDFIFGYTYIDASVTESFEFVRGNPATVIPDGSRLPGGAEHQAFVSANYRIPLGGSEIVLHTDASYRGDVLSNFRPIPGVPSMSFARFDAFTVWNASASWESGRYRVTLFGENLGNERGESSVTTSDFFGARDQGWGVVRPRTFGVRLTYQYD